MPKEIQTVMHDLEIQKLSHRGLDLLDARIAKFNHFTTINADQMIVLLVAI